MELRYTIAARLHLLHRWRCRWISDDGADTAYIGAYGELVAASYLRSHGLKVLRQDFRIRPAGEVDLVCRHGDTLVFCEVKTTTSAASGSPGRAVDRHKRGLLRSGARKWLSLMKFEVPYRFDIVEVYLFADKKPVVEWTRKAFTMQEGSTHFV